MRSSRLCGGVLMWESGGLGVVIPVVLVGKGDLVAQGAL